jgi:hypothetical protein
MDDAELDTFATGLGLDADWLGDVLDSVITDLDVGEIAAVCESLHCTPYDLWPPSAAHSILHAYGPEQWPRDIEPLSAQRPSDDPSFTARRLERQVADMVAWSNPVGPTRAERLRAARPSTTVAVTSYREIGVVVDDRLPGGGFVQDTTAGADPGVEYHIAFGQRRSPVRAELAMSASRFAAGPPPGHDVDPVLAAYADGLGLRAGPARAVMVRFTDPATGAEAWLGRFHDSTAWEGWDDPRIYWPGDPEVVLDPQGFPPPELQLPLPVARPEPDAVERAPDPVHDLGIDF